MPNACGWFQDIHIRPISIVRNQTVSLYHAANLLSTDQRRPLRLRDILRNHIQINIQEHPTGQIDSNWSLHVIAITPYHTVFLFPSQGAFTVTTSGVTFCPSMVSKSATAKSHRPSIAVIAALKQMTSTCGFLGLRSPNGIEISLCFLCICMYLLWHF